MLGDDEQALAVEQQLVRVAVERKRAEQARPGGVDRVELAARDREDPPTGGLHHVGLVNALLLDVGLRLIRLGARSVARGGIGPVVGESILRGGSGTIPPTGGGKIPGPRRTFRRAYRTSAAQERND